MTVWPHKSSPAEATASNFRRELAVTFDDVPLQPSPPDNDTLPDFETLCGINGRLLDKLRQHGIPAIGFVNEKRLHYYDRVDTRVSLLRMWLDAGLELGNHTFSHATPETASLTAYLKDIMRGEELTRPLLGDRGQRLRYFRHPQLHTGTDPEYKRGLEQFLEGRGYTIAPVTIKHQGWVYAVIYADAAIRRDVELMRRLAAAYLSYLEMCFEFFEQLSITVLGYEIRQILLLHVNELNTDHLNDMVEMIKGRGYAFVTLEHALEDKAYLLSDGYAGAKGPSWLHRWGYTMGLELPAEPREPEFIKELYRAVTEGSHG
jgi:peptidoglycan/xylan/chitin deacetylase (PgdA/CDA1 family)